MAAPSFISAYLDTALDIKDGETTRAYEHAERVRLSKAIAVAKAAGAIPRRLGEDAAERDLAADKRTAKRVVYALEQCLKAWGGKVHVAATKEDVQREGAQINWDKWWSDEQAYIDKRMRYIVTWQYKKAGSLKWTKSAVVKFQNELRWTRHALRAVSAEGTSASSEPDIAA